GRPHGAGVRRHGVFETDMHWLDKTGVARVGTSVVLPEMLHARRRSDVRPGYGKPAGPAAVQLVDLRSARPILTRFGVQRAGAATAILRCDLGAIRVRTRPQTRESPKQHVNARC